MREILEEVEAAVLTQMSSFIQSLAVLIPSPAGGSSKSWSSFLREHPTRLLLGQDLNTDVSW